MGPSQNLPFCPAQELREVTHLAPQLNRATVSCRSPDVHHGSRSASQPHWALPTTLFSPYLGHTGLCREIQTPLLTLKVAEVLYSRLPTGKHLLLEQARKHSEGTSPQIALTACPGSKAQTKTRCQTHMSPMSLCTNLGQSKALAKLWGSLKVEELSTCCDSARPQALMDAVWLHPSHSVEDTFPVSLLSCFFICLSIVLSAHTEVLIYDKSLHRSYHLAPGCSLLCSGVNILLDSSTAVSDLS